MPSGEKQGHKSWLPEVRNLTGELASDGHGFIGESVRDADAPHAVSVSRAIVTESFNNIRRIGSPIMEYAMISENSRNYIGRGSAFGPT